MRGLALGIERRRLISAMIALVLCIPAMLVLSASYVPWMTDPAVREDPTAAKTLALAVHDPILIDGNDGFTNESGVVWGSGTASDPYMIEDWDINASTANGIAIRNTSAHFIVRTCNVHDGLSNLTLGIYLLNCTNGTLDSNICSRNAEGIRFDLSSGNTIVNNTLTNHQYVMGGRYYGDGICLHLSSENTVIDNICEPSNWCGVHLRTSNNNTIVNNGGYQNLAYGTFLESSMGNFVDANVGEIVLSQSSNNSLSNNYCSDWKIGMSLYSSDGNFVSDNSCSGGWYGIYVETSNRNTFDGNILYGWEGIWLQSSSDNTLSNNYCVSDYSDVGIVMAFSSDNNTLNDNILSSPFGLGMAVISSSNNSLINNNCSYNGYDGIAIYNSSYNTLMGNELCFNVGYGVSIDMGSHNMITNNTFIGNNGATDTCNSSHVQAYDNSIGNWWNGTDGRGNYWSDWTTPDVDPPFGIVDLSYNISGSTGARDYYPLTTTPAEPIPEFAMMPFVVMVLLVATILTGIARRGKAH